MKIMPVGENIIETANDSAAPSRKRPLSAANGGGALHRPPSRAPSALGWGPLYAPQISIPESRLHLAASSRPRSRFNSVRKSRFCDFLLEKPYCS